MSRRYSFDSDPGEHAPLDYPNHAYSPYAHSSQPQQSPPSHSDRYYHDHTSSSSSTAHNSPTRAAPAPAPAPAPLTNHPGAHPDSAFNRLRDNRRYSAHPERTAVAAGAGAGAGAGIVAGGVYSAVESSGPVPPPHRGNSGRSSIYDAEPSSITPGADNFGEAASGGGMPGLAMNIADRNPRESGLEAMRGAQQPPYPPAYQRSPPQSSPYDEPQAHGYDRGYDQSSGYYGADPYGQHDHGYSSTPSLAPSGALAVPNSHSGSATPTRSTYSYSSDPFRDPHMAYGPRMHNDLGQFNPNDIDDDGDDGLDYRRSARNSMLSSGNSSSRDGSGAAAGAAGAAAAGGVMGGLMARNRNDGINYDPVHNTSAANQASSAAAYNLGGGAEKLSKQTGGKKMWKRWLVIVLVGLVIAGGIAGGVVGGVVRNNDKNSNKSSSGQSADDDSAKNGDLDINSSEIQALMNNKDLHKVFPGVDYTPINVQYPDCLKNPPSQNNITRDVAVLSQLTNTIRLYGTDCNQTEMTIHALNQLKLQDKIKIWLGVWQDGNDTTNKRQLSRMWNILDQYGDKPFKGLIIGNEVLFRKQMTNSQLSDLLNTVRSNLSDHSWNLPVATSDLGDNWTSDLAKISDYIMGNIHPFFAGVNAKEAASWTWSFWQNKAGTFFKTEKEQNIISEIGWPTKGGTDCGSDTVTSCPDGSVAGIDELNRLMEDWVCQALTNGTNYFWFEMFDEPWKISFNTEGKEWEDQWGIMDVNRNLKSGVKIPDCGGKTVS
ncbi:glycoside hydrolase family 17 protein [Whalleya microplaca]|nr:glycoside hydrolase family 17 protein [Whalleya microplaca]